MALHILIADADISSALTLAELLTNHGHSVETSRDGVHALAAAQQCDKANKAFDVIITAATLPGMDGVSLLRDLHMNNLTPHSALCVKPGELTDDLRQQALRLGCKTFLAYPVPLNDVMELVNSVGSSQRDDTPFFGTSRLGKQAEREISTSSHKVTTSSHQSSTGSYQRQRSGTIHVGHATKRVRRGVKGSFTEEIGPDAKPKEFPTHHPALAPGNKNANTAPPPPPAPPPQQQPDIPVAPVAEEHAPSDAPTAPGIPVAEVKEISDQFFPSTDRITKRDGQSDPISEARQLTGRSTARIRRSTSGSYTEEVDYATDQIPTGQGADAITSQAAKVACAHCHREFATHRKREAYNAVCIHCGGLNRILPF